MSDYDQLVKDLTAQYREMAANPKPRDPLADVVLLALVAEHMPEMLPTEEDLGPTTVAEGRKGRGSP